MCSLPKPTLFGMSLPSRGWSGGSLCRSCLLSLGTTHSLILGREHARVRSRSKRPSGTLRCRSRPEDPLETSRLKRRSGCRRRPRGISIPSSPLPNCFITISSASLKDNARINDHEDLSLRFCDSARYPCLRASPCLRSMWRHWVDRADDLCVRLPLRCQRRILLAVCSRR